MEGKGETEEERGWREEGEERREELGRREERGERQARKKGPVVNIIQSVFKK
jgi:hypothetical protein